MHLWFDIFHNYKQQMAEIPKLPLEFELKSIDIFSLIPCI